MNYAATIEATLKNAEAEYEHHSHIEMALENAEDSWIQGDRIEDTLEEQMMMYVEGYLDSVDRTDLIKVVK